MVSVAIGIHLKDVSLMISSLAFRLLSQFTACAFVFFSSVKNKPEIIAVEGFQWPVVTDKRITKCS